MKLSAIPDDNLPPPAGTNIQPSRRAGKQIEVAARRTEAARLSTLGYTAEQIKQIVPGYTSAQRVRNDLTRVRDQWRKRLEQAADEHVIDQLARLEHIQRRVEEVLNAEHLAHSGGKVVTRVTKWATDEAGNILVDSEGRPMAAEVEEMKDTGPILAAAAQARATSESIRKLLGLDRPSKVEVTGTVHHEYGTDISEV